MSGSDLETIVQDYAARHQLISALESRQKHCWQGDRRWPVLHLDDVSGIPFLSGIEGVDEYQHRARLRCGDGDLFATVSSPQPGYEEYCRDQLGLGSPHHLYSSPPDGQIRVSSGCMEGEVFSRLVEVARQAGGMLIEPYMGIEDCWHLASTVSDEAGVPVQMISPPPEITWVANDKALFSELVESVVGEDALVMTRTATDVASLVAHLREMFPVANRVAIKRTRCASAMGNRLFQVADLRALEDEEQERLIHEALKSMDWPEGEEVLACVWEETDLSPSTQWWIPPTGARAPRLDGIYEQILSGEEKLFVGSRPSTLSSSLNRALEDQSRPVVLALQQLGYVGRCSFDHLVVGDPDADPTLRITECNGRWGGTSTPMHLIDRVIPGDRPAYRAQDFVHPDLVGVPFQEIADRIGDHLLDVRKGEGQLLLYNVGPLKDSGKFDVVGIAATAGEADRLLEETLPRLLGLQ